MSSNSDKSPSDPYVAEKADAVLYEACRIVDLFRRTKLEISEDEKAEIASALHSLIFDAAKLSALGHGKLNSWSTLWVDLMFAEGSNRYTEFKQQISTLQDADNIQPSKWPVTIQNTFDLFAEAEHFLETDTSDHTLSRKQILGFSKQFAKSRFTDCQYVGNRLSELVDEQAVKNSLSWSDFMQECRILLQTRREMFLRQAEELIKPWA